MHGHSTKAMDAYLGEADVLAHNRHRFADQGLWTGKRRCRHKGMDYISSTTSTQQVQTCHCYMMSCRCHMTPTKLFKQAHRHVVLSASLVVCKQTFKRIL